MIFRVIHFPFVLVFCTNIVKDQRSAIFFSEVNKILSTFFLSKHLFKLIMNVYCFVVISLLKCSCNLIIILMLMVVLINIQSVFDTSFPGLTESHVRVQLFHEIIIVFIPSKTEAFCLFHRWIEN